MLWLLLFVVTNVLSYRHGDAVSMLRREQFQELRTKWMGMVGKDCPRFGMDHTVLINPSSLLGPFPGRNATDLASEPFKISFSFANDQHLIPWITVSDGRGQYLDLIRIVFSHTGGYLTGVRWTTEYHPINAAHTPPNIQMNYHWEEHRTVDIEGGLLFLFIVIAVVTWGCVSLVLLGDAHPAYYMPKRTVKVN